MAATDHHGSHGGGDHRPTTGQLSPNEHRQHAGPDEHGGHDAGHGGHLAPLLGLPGGHHPVVEEAAPHLAQHPGHVVGHPDVAP